MICFRMLSTGGSLDPSSLEFQMPTELDAVIYWRYVDMDSAIDICIVKSLQDTIYWSHCKMFDRNSITWNQIDVSCTR